LPWKAPATARLLHFTRRSLTATNKQNCRPVAQVLVTTVAAGVGDHEMTTSGADALWVRVAARLRTAPGWSLWPLVRLGRGRADRVTWLAEGEPSTVVVKAVTNPFAPDRAGWVAHGLSVLARRG
jgi:hypothetical protein